jgi:hypothetical protein
MIADSTVALQRVLDGLPPLPEDCRVISLGQACSKCGGLYGYEPPDAGEMRCTKCERVLWTTEDAGTDNALAEMKQAYDLLKRENGRPPSQRAVARKSGYHRSAVSARWNKIT